MKKIHPTILSFYDIKFKIRYCIFDMKDIKSFFIQSISILVWLIVFIGRFDYMSDDRGCPGFKLFGIQFSHYKWNDSIHDVIYKEEK